MHIYTFTPFVIINITLIHLLTSHIIKSFGLIIWAPKGLLNINYLSLMPWVLSHKLKPQSAIAL